MFACYLGVKWCRKGDGLLLEQGTEVTLLFKVFVMISVENLHLTIEGKEILKGIDLHLQPGAALPMLIFNRGKKP
jgi:hypothetical protein